MTISDMLGSKTYSEVATKMASLCENLVKKTAFLPDEMTQWQNASEKWKQLATAPFDVKQWLPSTKQLQEFIASCQTKNVVFSDSNEVRQVQQELAEIISYLTNSGQK